MAWKSDHINQSYHTIDHWSIKLSNQQNLPSLKWWILLDMQRQSLALKLHVLLPWLYVVWYTQKCPSSCLAVTSSGMILLVTFTALEESKSYVKLSWGDGSIKVLLGFSCFIQQGAKMECSTLCYHFSPRHSGTIFKLLLEDVSDWCVQSLPTAISVLMML